METLLPLLAGFGLALVAVALVLLVAALLWFVAPLRTPVRTPRRPRPSPVTRIADLGPATTFRTPGGNGYTVYGDVPDEPELTRLLAQADALAADADGPGVLTLDEDAIRRLLRDVWAQRDGTNTEAE